MEKIQNSKYTTLLSSPKEGWITFFTPTYNRSQFLHRIYVCLLNQTDDRFVWIVVNDGSEDETDKVVKDIVAENKIPILYILKENGGKQSAFKVAFENCNTDFLMCMDDDDIYSEEAVETYLKEWEGIKDDSIGAIRTLTQWKDGSFLSNIPIKKEDLGKRIDVDTLTYNYVYKIRQENWTCYKMNALKQVEIFPSNYWMSEKHKFFTEAIWQGRFARHYKCRYLYIALRVYSTEAVESLTRRKPSRQRYVDNFINTLILINEQLDYRIKNQRKFLYDVIWMTSTRRKLGIKLSDFIHHVNNPIMKIVFVFLSPLSFILRRPYIPSK